jgi:hypothetical protein
LQKGNIMGIMDTKPAKGQTGEKEPKGVNASDASGERKARLSGGVGMGKMDAMGSRPLSHAGNFEGRLGELNDGNMGEREVYSHKRVPHVQDEK